MSHFRLLYIKMLRSASLERNLEFDIEIRFNYWRIVL